MAGLGEKFKYEPILPQAPLDMDFHYYETQEDGTEVLKIKESDEFILAKSLDDIRPFIEKAKDKMIAFDTETTGLTYYSDKIVGYSISLDDHSGIYVPIRHTVKVISKVQVDLLDENGNQVLTKSGRPRVTTKKVIDFEPCDENLDPKGALDILYEILTGAKMVLAHNSMFDLIMLKAEGYDVTKIKAFDTLILPYLYDPEATGLANLKALEKRVLGRIVPEFKDVLGKDFETFAEVPPIKGYHYAIYDVCGLIGVFKVLFPKVKELLGRCRERLVLDGKPYDVLKKDNDLVMAFVDYYAHANILINRSKALKYKEQLEAKQRDVIKQIYDYFDAGMFNLSTSSKEFKEVMYSKNVVTGIKTDKGGDSWSSKASGDWSRNLNNLKATGANWRNQDYNESTGVYTKKDVFSIQFASNLELYGKDFFKIDSHIKYIKVKLKNGKIPTKMEFWSTVRKIYDTEMEKFKILALIQENNSLNKALNSYVDKLTQVDECKMNYRLKGTKSGRLSSGNGSKSDKRKNAYYIDLNAQNLTKPKSSYYVAEKCTEEDPESILGWKFTSVEKDYAMEHLEDLYIVEGQDSGITIRGCLEAPKGSTYWTYVPDENGTEEQPIFEVLLSNGNSIKVSKDAVFKIKWKNKVGFLTLPEVVKRKLELVEGVTIKGLKKLGALKCAKLEKGAHNLGGVSIYSGKEVGKRYVVSLDYDAEEYKLLAALSQDSVMISNFHKGIDPHTASAYAIWGEENYDKQKRKKAKIFNFLNNYSGGAGTLAQQLDIPKTDAQEMINNYNKTFHEMVSWKEKEIERMYQENGVVFTVFGRPRQFIGWLNVLKDNMDNYTTLLEQQELQRASNGVRAAIERRVNSHEIQGAAGDILRRVLLNLYRDYFKERDPFIDFMSTVHDEVNYTIDVTDAVTYTRELEDLMTFDVLDETLPITTSTDIGFSYGSMFPFVWTDESRTEMVPKRTHHA